MGAGPASGLCAIWALLQTASPLLATHLDDAIATALASVYPMPQLWTVPHSVLPICL